jgi:hypothetical protein
MKRVAEISLGAEKAACAMSLGGQLDSFETPAKFDEKLFTIRL